MRLDFLTDFQEQAFYNRGIQQDRSKLAGKAMAQALLYSNNSSDYAIKYIDFTNLFVSVPQSGVFQTLQVLKLYKFVYSYLYMQ